MPTKPVRLRQRDAKNRLAFWISVSLAILVVVVVWMQVIQQVIYEGFVVVREQTEESFDRIAEEIVEISTDAREIREFGEGLSENYQLYENAYKEERDRQQALEEETETN